MKKNKEVLQLINKSLKIERDKAGWNIALRVLLVMNFVELFKLKEASTSIISLKKHIERNNKITEIKQRDISILKLLNELEKDDFKRNEKNKKVVKLIDDLSNKTGPIAWSYYTPELIPFHEWVLELPVKN
jgi:hypothetical protein